MMLDLVLRVSWICFLLFSSGACFPTVTQDELSAGGWLSDSGGVAAGGFYRSSVGGSPWVAAPVGGALFSDSQNWLPPHSFPDLNAWYTYDVPLGMVAAPPLLPSSYIIQSGNGYQRGREALSYSKYSDDLFGPFPLTQYL